MKGIGINERNFDAMLESACCEIMDERVAEWEAASVDEHEFSPEFIMKMEKLFRDVGITTSTTTS